MEIDLAKTHLAEMLQARGEDTTELEKALKDIPPERFYTDVIHHRGETTTLWIALSKESFKETWKAIKDVDVGDLIADHKTRNFVMITSEKPSSQTIPGLAAKDEELVEHGGMLQWFLLKDLQINPTKHECVPKHERLSDAEAKKLMEDLRLKHRLQLPAIYRKDPQAVWLGLRAGDIVRITRKTPTAGQTYYYRCCVADSKTKTK